MTGKIRLGCLGCGREDFDGIHKLPDDWEEIDEVQSYEESIREVGPEDDGDIMFWETHLGVCPECKEIQGQQAAGSTPAGAATKDTS